MKKTQLREEAKKMYTKEFQAFTEIAKKIKVSERTLRTWAKQENWDQERDLFIQKTKSILSDRIEIANMLGTKIKQLLKKGKEPAASTLNAYRSMTDGLAKVSQFEETSKKETQNENNLKDLTKKALKDTFGYED